MSEVLKSCPCCGDDVRLADDGSGDVICDHCGASAPELSWRCRVDEAELERLRQENAKLRDGSARLMSMSNDSLATLMANCGLIDHAAVEDPEGYDGYVTLERVGEFKDRLTGEKEAREAAAARLSDLDRNCDMLGERFRKDGG